MSADKFDGIVSLLNDLEKAAQDVAVSKGQKLDTKPDYGPNIKIGAKFKQPSFNKKFQDYSIQGSGQPASLDWLRDQMRNRVLPGQLAIESMAVAYSTPGDFRDEWNSAAALLIKSVNIILREEDIPIYAATLTQGIVELQADEGMLASNKQELKQKFLKDFVNSVVSAFNLTSDLSERTPNDLAKEAHVAYALSGNKTSRDQHGVKQGLDTLQQVFASADTKHVATEDDRATIFAEGAVKFREARKMDRTMQEMGLMPSA